MNVAPEDRELYVDTARRVVEDHALPLLLSCEEEERFPLEVMPAFREAGLLGGTIPSEHGGSGLDHLTQVMVIEEVSRRWQVLGSLVAMASGPVGRALLQFGTAEQQEQYLQPLAGGLLLAGYALTEAQSGTDAAAMRTRAHRDRSGWVLTGTKLWIDWAMEGDFFLTFARTDPESVGARGISAFVVERGNPGFTTASIRGKVGLRALSVGELIFDEATLAPDALLGAEGEGFKVAMAALEEARLGVAARVLGGLQGCLDQSASYARDRLVFGQPLGTFQMTQQKIADMVVAVEAARALTYHAAELLDSGRPASRSILAAKLYAQEAFMRSSHDAVQLFGAYGMTEDAEVNRYFRDAKVTEVTGGTSEILRILLAEQATGIGARGSGVNPRNLHRRRSDKPTAPTTG